MTTLRQKLAQLRSQASEDQDDYGYLYSVTDRHVATLIDVALAADPGSGWLSYIARFSPDLCTTSVSTDGKASPVVRITDHAEALRKALQRLGEVVG